MNLVVRPELPTASVVRRKRRPPPWTTLHRSTHPESTYKSGKVVQTTGATSELYSLVGLEVPPEDIVAADATRFLPSETSEAKRDAKFSVRVLPAYDYTCALTRYRMIATNGTTSLDAAHIHQFKKGGGNHPTNGIALSKTAHWLFDRGFWSITNDLRVIVAEHRFEEVGEEAYLLKKMAGREMLRPANLHFLPDPQSLAWHRQHHKFEGA